MTVAEVINQIKVVNGRVVSLSSGKEYEIEDFIVNISTKCKFNKTQINELRNFLSDFIKVQTQDSKYVENIIKKYEFKYSDGVYIIRGKVISLEDLYRLFWKEERLLPDEASKVIENIEKISEPMDLQNEVFTMISARARIGKSKYLESLYTIYPDVKWKELLYNIIVPNTKPLFHILYDDGVGGTGKSTLLEVLTMIAKETFTSNILLDQFGNRFIFANMVGKYFNLGDDNGKNPELQNVGTLKSIITGNRVTIDRKFMSPIEVRIFAKQLFATNILPYIDFTDGGIMRRLNIVQMNKVIPKELKLCKLNEEEIGHIIYEVLQSCDLDENKNELAITTSPLYRFYISDEKKTYDNYKSFCYEFGFGQMNIINFEVKSKFVQSFISGRKNA